MTPRRFGWIGCTFWSLKRLEMWKFLGLGKGKWTHIISVVVLTFHCGVLLGPLVGTMFDTNPRAGATLGLSNCWTLLGCGWWSVTTAITSCKMLGYGRERPHPSRKILFLWASCIQKQKPVDDFKTENLAHSYSKNSCPTVQANLAQKRKKVEITWNYMKLPQIATEGSRRYML